MKHAPHAVFVFQHRRHEKPQVSIETDGNIPCCIQATPSVDDEVLIMRETMTTCFYSPFHTQGTREYSLAKFPGTLGILSITGVHALQYLKLSAIDT